MSTQSPAVPSTIAASQDANTTQPAQPWPPGHVITTRTWCNYVLEVRREYGAAAQRNRSRHSGTKVHKLTCEYIVGLVDASLVEHPRTMGATFKRTGQPVLFSCGPVCGTTRGQHAGAPIQGLTAAHITCTRCA